MAHEVTLIPGDGTGPELTEATRRVLEATGADFDWDVLDAGADVMEGYGGNPLPDANTDSLSGGPPASGATGAEVDSSPADPSPGGPPPGVGVGGGSQGRPAFADRS